VDEDDLKDFRTDKQTRTKQVLIDVTRDVWWWWWWWWRWRNTRCGYYIPGIAFSCRISCDISLNHVHTMYTHFLTRAGCIFDVALLVVSQYWYYTTLLPGWDCLAINTVASLSERAIWFCWRKCLKWSEEAKQMWHV